MNGQNAYAVTGRNDRLILVLLTYLYIHVIIGAYKTHLLSLNVDLGPSDAIPDVLDKFVNVEFTMNNSTVSHAQIRSVSVSGSPAEDPPDRWVRHSARYEYTVEIEFTDRVRCKPEAGMAVYDGDDETDTAFGTPRRSSRAASTERSRAGATGRPGDRSASAPPITADDSSDESPPTDDSD